VKSRPAGALVEGRGGISSGDDGVGGTWGGVESSSITFLSMASALAAAFLLLRRLSSSATAAVPSSSSSSTTSSFKSASGAALALAGSRKLRRFKLTPRCAPAQCKQRFSTRSRPPWPNHTFHTEHSEKAGRCTAVGILQVNIGLPIFSIRFDSTPHLSSHLRSCSSSLSLHCPLVDMRNVSNESFQVGGTSETERKRGRSLQGGAGWRGGGGLTDGGGGGGGGEGIGVGGGHGWDGWNGSPLERGGAWGGREGGREHIYSRPHRIIRDRLRESNPRRLQGRRLSLPIYGMA
jgi:hypothetical protein